MKKICKITSIVMIIILSLFVITACNNKSNQRPIQTTIAPTTAAPETTMQETNKPNVIKPTASVPEATRAPKAEITGENYSIPVTIINNTGYDIYGVYASLTQSDSWEENLLTSVLYDGYYIVVTFNFSSDQTVWDFALEDYSGNLLEFYEIDFNGCSTDGITLDFTYDYVTGEGTVYWE